MTDDRVLNPSDLKKMKVLIVDPNSFMRGVVADSLRRLMVTHIMAAASAVEAFNVGRMFKPDIIFVSASGLGRTGPERDMLAYGSLLQAYS